MNKESTNQGGFIEGKEKALGDPRRIRKVYAEEEALSRGFYKFK